MISTSLFELFKIGPGPSSSHTIGPMRMGYEFVRALRGLARQTLGRATAVEMRLFGSLAATGAGHGTHRAVLAGLLGREPETCPPGFLETLDEAGAWEIEAGGKRFPVSLRTVVFDAVEHPYPAPNTLVARLLEGEQVLFEREYYSVGGGFIDWKGRIAPRRGAPVHPYDTAEQVAALLQEKSISLHRLLLENEQAVSGASEQEILRGLDRVMEVMEAAVERGLAAEGRLPGTLGVFRKAAILHKQARAFQEGHGRLLVTLDAYAFAVGEENAAGSIVVTAPTTGAAGVVPSVLRLMKKVMGLEHVHCRQGLLAAALVGFLCKHNASIAGAEVGCQGEVGVASAMAAAMLCHALGRPFDVVENAAEVALEHHLGLTCDPVGGYVQIPCIERNAMGAVKAFNAYVIAASEDPGHHKVGLDHAIAAMAATGRDMCTKYKETSQGGLAVCLTEC